MSELFVYLNQCRILTLVRNGKRGCDQINILLQKYLQPFLDKKNNYKVFAGMPVMILSNDYKRNLFNGDIGIVLKINHRYYVGFKRLGYFEIFDYAELPENTSAFASTVHKSQGSEFDHVLVILPEYENRLMSREIIYTALTRAKYFVGIYGSEDILKKCIQTRIIR